MTLKDSKYIDNVILQKDTLQELLTNIKNYPIIDIDYVDENEIDQLHNNTENGNNPNNWKIWETYTDGTPCIKITYGDNKTTKGNIIFADALKRLIREKQMQKASLEEDKKNYKDEEDFYNKVFEENEKIYNERKQTLDTWIQIKQNNLNSQSNLIKLLEVFDQDNLSEEDARIALGEFYPLFHTFDANNQININDYASKEIVNIGQDSESSTTYELEVYVFNDKSPFTSRLQNIIFNSNSTNEQITAANKLINIIEAYPTYVMTTIIDNSDPNNPVDVGHQIIDINQNQELYTIQQYVGVYLNEVIHIAWIKKENAKKLLDDIKGKYNRTLDEITEIDDKIEIWNSWIPLIAAGTHTLADTSDENEIGYPYKLITINSENAKDRTMYGYKYVKVGSNILWDKNINFKEITDPDNIIQRNGHFRVTINGHTYEIPIKGFEQSGPIVADTSNGFLENVQYYKEFFDDSEPPMSLGIHELGWDNNEIEQNPIEGVIYYLSKDNEILPTGNGVTNLGSPDNKWGTIYGVDLGSEKYPFENGYFEHGYFDEIKIGDVVIGGEGGSGDSGKFLRGDGAWSNELTGSILISDDTEAVRTSPGYIVADTDDLITNEILIEDDESPYPLYQYTGEYNAPTGNPPKLFYVHRGTGPDSGGLPIKDGNTIIAYGKELKANHYFDTVSTYYAGDYCNYGTNNCYIAYSGGSYVGPGVETDDPSKELPEAFGVKILHQYIFADGQASNYYILYDNEYIQCVQNEKYTNQFPFYTTGGDDIADPAVGYGLETALVNGSIATYGGISARKSIKGYKVYGAVFNDYAEYRTTLDAKPGSCVIDLDNGSLQLSTKRLIPGAQIISDTFGTCMGKTAQHQTPLAVAGRVLAYPYKPREEYHAGMAVCSAPNGTVDIMTREEIRDYPDAIIGIVSEIPQYEVWGSDDVQVDGRIWIKVR